MKTTFLGLSTDDFFTEMISLGTGMTSWELSLAIAIELNETKMTAAVEIEVEKKFITHTPVIRSARQKRRLSG